LTRKQSGLFVITRNWFIHPGKILHVFDRRPYIPAILIGMTSILAGLAFAGLHNMCWIGDEAFYYLLAENLATSGAYRWINGVETGYPFPLYPLVMAGWMKIFGPEFSTVQLQNIIIGAAICVTTYFLGRRIFGTRIGILAGFLVAIHPETTHYTIMLLSDPLAATLNILALIFLASYDVKSKGRTDTLILLASGVCFGLSILAHLRSVFIAATILFVYLVMGRHKIPIRSLLLVISVSLLISGAWMARNTLRWGSPVGGDRVPRLQEEEIKASQGGYFGLGTILKHSIFALPTKTNRAWFIYRIYRIVVQLNPILVALSVIPLLTARVTREPLIVIFYAIPLVIFTLFATWSTSAIYRYLYIAIPFISILSSKALADIADRIPTSQRNLEMSSSAKLAITALVMLTVFSLVVAHGSLDQYVFKNEELRGPSFIEAADWIEKNTKPTSRILCGEALWTIAPLVKRTYIRGATSNMSRNLLANPDYIVLDVHSLYIRQSGYDLLEEIHTTGQKETETPQSFLDYSPRRGLWEIEEPQCVVKVFQDTAPVDILIYKPHKP